MMNSSTLSPESSSVNPQGLGSKDKKGKAGQPKNLFSRLLATLQQNVKKGEGTNTDSSKTSMNTTTSLSKNNLNINPQVETNKDKKNKNPNLGISIPKKSLIANLNPEQNIVTKGSTTNLNSEQSASKKEQFVALAIKNNEAKEPSTTNQKTALSVSQTSSKVVQNQAASDISQETNEPQTKKNKLITTDVIAVAQEPITFIIQPTLKKSVENNVEGLQSPIIALSKGKTKGQPVINLASKKTNTNTQQTQSANLPPEKINIDTPQKQQVTNSLSWSNTIEKINVGTQQKQQITSASSQPNVIDKQVKAKLTSKTIVSPATQTAKSSSQTSTLVLEVQNTSKKVIGTDVGLKPVQQSTIISAHEPVIEASLQSKQRLNNQQINQSLAATHAQISENQESELKNGSKKLSSPIATAQQQTVKQSQAQPTTFSVNQENSSIIARLSESGNAASQQDINANQQDADFMLSDASKTDSKMGKDFQAQLAYKSQRTFTPADTMLEIVRSAKDGSTSLELQLEPANLGKVLVSIQIDAAKQIQVAFTVDQAMSRQALEQHMPQLRLAMAQQGLDLGGFSMQMNQGNSQQQHSSSEQSSSGDHTNTTSLTTHDENDTRIGVNLASTGHLSIRV